MPKSTKIIVINTSPLIALIAAWGNLKPLGSLYDQVLVPFEVCQEILKGGPKNFGITEFQQATWLKKKPAPLKISPLLLNSLDLGEASVIQLAMDQGISTVCIDEAVGRRVARLSGLVLTGSVGILIKAKQQNPTLSVKQAIANMVARNIRLSPTVINFALEQSGER